MEIRNLLIVDDDSDDGEFFTTVVQQIDPTIAVTVAGSKEELFRYLTHRVPDLLFVDSYIQQDSGHASIQEIRADSRFAGLPIIMYTGSSHLESIKKAFRAGASFYIVKPDSLPQIKAVLQHIFNRDWQDISAIQKQYYMDNQFQNYESEG